MRQLGDIVFFNSYFHLLQDKYGSFHKCRFLIVTQFFVKKLLNFL